MVATVGSIRTIFEADMGRYSAGLIAGEKRTAQFSNRVGGRVGSIRRDFAGLATVGRSAFLGVAAGATAALAPILSVAGALNGARAALTEFDRIGKAAKAGGLDAEAFQEFAYAAELGGVTTDQFATALQAFARNAGMAAIGKGELVEKLKLLHPELLKNITAARTQEERLRLVADALDKETDASRKAAIAAAAFGESGVKMLEMLKGGSAALDETARKARALGIVVDRDLIAKSETLNDELSTAWKVMDLQFKQALINLAPILVSVAGLAARFATDIRGMVDAMRDLENRGTQSLSGRMRELGAERLQVENEILRLKGQQADITGATAEMERRLLDGTISTKRSELKAIADEEARILKILNERKPAEPTLPSTTPSIPEISGGRDKAAQAAVREAEAVKELIATLQFERDQIGLTDLQKRTNETLRRAGAAATAEEREQIKSLVAEIERETTTLEANKAAQEQRARAIESLFTMGGDALQSIVDGSMKAEDALKRLIVQLAQAALQAALLGSGPLAGLFGGGGGAFLGTLFTLNLGKETT